MGVLGFVHQTNAPIQIQSESKLSLRGGDSRAEEGRCENTHTLQFFLKVSCLNGVYKNFWGNKIH